MKVVTVDEYIAKVVPEVANWTKNLGLKDKVIVTGTIRDGAETDKNKNNSLKSVSKLKTKKVAVKQKSNLASFEILNPATLTKIGELPLYTAEMVEEKSFWQSKHKSFGEQSRLEKGLES